MKALLLLLFITLTSCGAPLILTYNNVSNNDTTYTQRNMFVFHKGYITHTTIDKNANQGFVSRNYTTLWQGDSVRFDNYADLMRKNKEYTFKIDTSSTCLIITGRINQTRYCK
jgi:hypothetical protein